MRAMAFKLILLLGVSFLPLAASLPAYAANGIPVQCANCVDATDNAAKVIVKTIQESTVGVGQYLEAQTQAIEKMLEFFLDAQEYNAGHRETLIGETQDAKYNERAVGLGAKPFGACGEYAATAMAGQKVLAQRVTSRQVANIAKERTRQSRKLPPGEPPRQKAVDDIIELLDDDENKETFTAAELLYPDEPIPPSKWSEVLQKLMAVLAPFPVVTPSEKEIEDIKAHGTTGERERLAQSIAMQRRQEIGLKAATLMAERNLQNLSSGPMKELIEIAKEYTVDPAAWNGNLSANQIDDLLNTYRLNSPDWHVEVATSESEFYLLREQAQMQALMLQNMWEIRKLLMMQLSLTGATETRNVAQQGMMSR